MTDHRAEAVTDLDAAFSHMLDIGQDDPDAKWRTISSALIGIGHALLTRPPLESTVEIGGQVMTEAQFHAARFPLLNPDPGPAVPDTDTRCQATSDTGQCLDYQGHNGGHQWPVTNTKP